MWGACKGMGKGYGGMGPYGGGKGKWGGGGGDSWAFQQAPAPAAAPAEEEWVPKKKKGGGAAWKGEIPGFIEALKEAFKEAGIEGVETEGDDSVLQEAQSSVKTASKKFHNDERASSKMTAAGAGAFIGEFIEAAMNGLSTTFWENKEIFDKVSWNGALLMAVFYAFENGKIFSRVLKSQVMELIDDGILAWIEDVRIRKKMWEALEAANFKGGEATTKKAFGFIQSAYDEAHFSHPLDDTEGVSPEMAELQSFVHGAMTLFANKTWAVLDKNLEDGSPEGQTACLTGIFQSMLDPNSPCLPLPIQGHLPQESPWPWIEVCAGEVIQAAHEPKDN